MRVSACYCTFCQRRTGGAWSIHAFFDEQNIELIGDGLTTYEHHSDESGLCLRLHSCKRCATTVMLTLLKSFQASELSQAAHSTTRTGSR